MNRSLFALPDPPLNLKIPSSLHIAIIQDTIHNLLRILTRFLPIPLALEQHAINLILLPIKLAIIFVNLLELPILSEDLFAEITDYGVFLDFFAILFEVFFWVF